MKKVSTLMALCNIDRIDIIKMDIEGSEFAVVPQMFADGIFPQEICIELHERFFKRPTKKLKNFISQMNKNGYQIAHVSKYVEEFTFVRE